jgi:hypothetical protein
MAYDAGDYQASLKKAMEIADVKGFGKRKARQRRAGKLRGHRLFDLHRGLRHRAVAGGGSLGAASAFGNPPRCGSIRPVRWKC